MKEVVEIACELQKWQRNQDREQRERKPGGSRLIGLQRQFLVMRTPGFNHAVRA
jgi:hypothetical protein